MPHPALPAAAQRTVPIDLIRPGQQQARRHFDAQALHELTESVRASGVVQPVVLRQLGREYELLAGERRWRAAQAAGLHEIPAVIRNDLSDDEAFVLGLVENLQRESLSPMETAHGLRRLAALHGLTHEEVGQRIGKSREYVSNFLRLLALAPAVQQAVDRGELSTGHAKALAGVPTQDQPAWLGECRVQGWSVRQLERQIALHRRGTAVAAPAAKSADWLRMERSLADHLGTHTEVEMHTDGRGEIRIRFHSLDALDGVLEKIGVRFE